MRVKPQGPSAARPRLSPTNVNGDRPGPDYFAPPTPAVERGPPVWGTSGTSDGGPVATDENGQAAGGFEGRSTFHHDAVSGGQAGFTFGGSSGGFGAEAGPAGKVSAPDGWAASAPPSFALSPSSTAFNAKFNHLLRGPSSSGGPGTPLHAPASSPFFPSSDTYVASPAATATANPFNLAAPPSSSSSPSAHPVPPTPGPSTTAGISFPSSSATPPSLSFPMSMPPGRRVAGRPSSLSARPSASSAPVVHSSRYTLYNPQTLFSVLLSSAPRDGAPDSPPLLILDIRPHTAYVAERLTGAINICVPSTLLRRPAFGIDRVAEGLSPADQAVFEKWASAAAIVVLDNESTSLVEGGGVVSLLAKFDKAGFAGKLGWVKGGWYAVRTQLRGLAADEQQALLHSGPAGGSPSSAPGTGTSMPLDGAPQQRGALSASLAADPTSSPSGASAGAGSKKHGRPVLQVRDLPAAAFQLASTSAYMHESVRGGAPGNPGALPTSRRGVDAKTTSPPSSEGEGSISSLASQRPEMGKRRKSGNEPGKRDQLRTSANPFFDNIRQNSEALSLEGSLAHLTPVELPNVPPAVAGALPSYLQALLRLSPMSRADRLARQFYELEVAERERLEGMFRFHAQQTALEAGEAGSGQKGGAQGGAAAKSDSDGEHWAKFGISAGVELGHLNRFKNIFPYEHSRVRLKEHSPSATDYVNASHLFLRGSTKRFIASQGPLPTTFRDFWQMCDQEHVGVVIMLTNLREAGRDKCGRYWVPQHDGEWDVSVDGDAAHEEEDRERLEQEAASAANGPGGGFFAAFGTKPENAEPSVKDSTVRRTITVQRRPREQAASSSSSSASSAPRKIRHIQYRAWPDFDIPAEPSDVVALVDEVDAAQRDYMREIGWDVADHDGLEPPILAHCSAGVGRTGVFIMVSSLLAQLRRDLGGHLPSSSDGAAAATGDAMDIDATGDSAASSSGAATPSRPPLAERQSDPETSQLSAGLSLSSLGGPPASPGPPPHPVLPSLDVPALEQPDPVFAGVNELREQRMSLVANARQFRSVYECLLEGAVRLLKKRGTAST
ncbi:hypothetical protein JCM3775_000905 [Rhodotorula graminis]